jgi:hypothetical protein
MTLVWKENCYNDICSKRYLFKWYLFEKILVQMTFVQKETLFKWHLFEKILGQMIFVQKDTCLNENRKLECFKWKAKNIFVSATKIFQTNGVVKSSRYFISPRLSLCLHYDLYMTKLNQEKPNWRRRVSTDDLPVITCLDQLLINEKQAALMRRSTNQSLPHSKCSLLCLEVYH